MLDDADKDRMVKLQAGTLSLGVMPTCGGAVERASGSVIFIPRLDPQP